MKIIGKCSACRKHRWFVKQRQITLPNGLKATSRELLCNGCSKKLALEIKI